MGTGLFGALLAGFGTLALDATAALLSGSSEHVTGLKDKSVRSNAYGTPWSRGRGVIRLEGKVLWATHIQASLWKTVSGGLFGIGTKSVTYEKYSVSQFIGFGYKLGGGAAVDILRIWADGKLLFNKVTSTGSLSGATVTVVGGGQPSGQQYILLDIASGGSLNLNAGDLIINGVDPQPYTVQSAVSVTGPATSVSVPVWPPLRQSFAGGSAAQLSQQSVSPYDLSSFDPNPHDGSHTSGGYPCPPGGIAFYMGSATQTADPTMVKHLGAANVPGYRGLAAICLHDLQLANYGNHCPQITAEVAFDIGTPQYPMLGPIPNAPLSGGGLSSDSIALPYSGNEAMQWMDPLSARLPYIWVFSGVGATAGPPAMIGTIYRFNTSTHLVEASVLQPSQGTFGLTGAGMVADNDGYLYFVEDNAHLNKMDGQTLIGTVRYPIASGYSYNISTLYCYDTTQSLFGNAVILKLAFFGGVMYDRTAFLPLGTANTLGLDSVVVGYTANPDGSGKPIIATGDAIVFGGYDPGTANITDDAQGNLWVGSGNLQRINGQFISTITLDQNNQPIPTLALPSFAFTTIAGPIFCYSVQYHPGDDTVVAFDGSVTTKVSCSTLAVVATGAGLGGTPHKISQTYDPMGQILIGGGSGTVRYDLATLSVVGSAYNPSNWPDVPVFGSAWVYDPYTDSAWFNGSSALNQALLDRGTGSGFPLDAVLTSLFLEAGYSAGEFDVTSITLAGLTLGGWEFERKTFKESLQELMRYFLFDVAEIDGKIHCVARGQASAITIPEDDLGALEDPSKYEPRLIELLQDERDTPRKVTLKYYDYLKDDQQATQEALRIAQPYPSSITGAKANTSSQQQLDIVSPLFENALKVKQQADIILWDQWAGRFTRTAKLGPKYIQLDPTDVVTYDYKGLLLETRLTEADFGSGFARQLIGSSQDVSVYTSSVTSASSGTGGGVIGTPPVATRSTYTIVPASPLSEVSATDIHMADVTATFSPSGARAFYNNRDFTVPDPGSTPTLYYVTVHDPNGIGEVPGTTSLTAYCDTDPAAAFVGVTDYIFMGTITITHDGTGVVVTSGGSGQTAQAIGFYVNGGGSTPPPSGVSIDLITYMVDPQRATRHLHGFAANGSGTNIYTYLDPATHSLAQIKTSAGHPWDIYLYDNTYIYHFITELDDVGYRDWNVATSYKKFNVSHGYPLPQGVPRLPRFFTPGTTVNINVPSPNPYGRYQSCAQFDVINNGAVTQKIYGPITMNFDSVGPNPGNLGNIQVVVVEKYFGLTRERYYWGLNLGFVKWDAGHLVSGSPITGQYNIFNWSVHNQLVAGGGVAGYFPCGGWGAGWP